MQVIKCWELMAWDGGSGNNSIGYMSDGAEAEKWKAENMGSYISEITLIIAANCDELHQVRDERKRQQALAKLTPAERKLLGLE